MGSGAIAGGGWVARQLGITTDHIFNHTSEDHESHEELSASAWHSALRAIGPLGEPGDLRVEETGVLRVKTTSEYRSTR